jgi:hypothetical protein
MTRHGEEEGTGVPASERQGAPPDDGRVPPPEPEEVPELLGERSDYPLPREPRTGDGGDAELRSPPRPRSP